MYIAPRWIDRNLTRSELVVVIVILLFLIGTFSHYALVIYSNAERTMLNTTISNIRTALHHRVLLSRMENGGKVRIPFHDFNPMTDMQAAPIFNSGAQTRSLEMAGYAYPVVDTPANYIGELSGPAPEGLDKGVWYFDRRNLEIVYTVINTEYFETPLPGQKRVRYRVVLSYDDTNGDGIFDPKVDEFHSIDLQSPDHFEWKT